MGDPFATDDAEIDEALTAAIAEVFFAAYGLVIPRHVAVTITGHIILRPIDDEGHGRALVLN